MNSEEEAVQRGIRLISDECDEQMRLMDVVLNMTVSSASMERLKKLHDILTGKNTDEQFAKLKPDDRKAILEILLDTKKNLPDYWRKM